MFARHILKVLDRKGTAIFHKCNSTVKYKCTLSAINKNNINGTDSNETSFLSLPCKKLLMKRNIQRQLSSQVEVNTIKEVNYARNVLENSKVCSNSLAVPLLQKEDIEIDKVENIIRHQWIGNTNEEVLKNFEIVSQYAHTRNESLYGHEFIEILRGLENNCKYFSDKELFHLLNCLELWKHLYRGCYLKFWKVLDDECLKRITNWSIDEILLVNDHFYKFKILTSSKFTSESLRTLDFTKMSTSNLVQSAFFLRVGPKLRQLNLQKFELRLQQCIHELTIEELGIIAMAFFRYETQIYNENLITLIISKLMNDIDTVGDITLGAILKMLRYSINLSSLSSFNLLLDVLVPQVSRRQLPTITHIAHMQGATLLYNEKLLSEIINRFEKNIQIARLKDIERLLFTLYIFNYNPKTTPIYSIAAEELQNPARSWEIGRFAKSVTYSVMHMILVNYYPDKLLKIVMEPDFIQKSCMGDFTLLDREYIVLDYSIEIENPTYDGPRLNKFLKNLVLRKLDNQFDKRQTLGNRSHQMMMDVMSILEAVTYSDSNLYVDKLLPHYFVKNIVLCYDKKNKRFLSPKEKLSKYPYGSIKYAPNDDNQWFVVLIGSHNVITRNTFMPTGVLAANARQLELIGYTPIIIPYTEWKNLPKPFLKQSFIRNLLNI